MKQIVVPDIGDFKDVPVIEILVAVGDHIRKDQAVAMLESEKAVMEIPSPDAGIVASVDVKVGDRISAGVPLLSLRDAGAATSPENRVAANGSGLQPEKIATTPAARDKAAKSAAPVQQPSTARPAPAVELPVTNVLAFTPPAAKQSTDTRIYAGPAVRKLARELGVDLQAVKGTGPRGRIVQGDVHGYVQSFMSSRGASTAEGAGAVPIALLPWPKVDFAKFGPIEAQPLSRIRKISGANLHRNWVSIPHVTNHDDADVTDMESFRIELNREHEKSGVKISPLAFIMKASVAALKAFPDFNSSLDGETLIVKRYYHIGFAADTPNGLVVPVIRDADQKGIVQIAREMGELAAKARGGKLSSADMQGGTFSISSLGGIGGSYFTPIINAPEVAILGVGKNQTRVTWKDGQAQPRLYMPISLSWDHRVIDGAAAGRFNAYLVRTLGDLRRLLV